MNKIIIAPSILTASFGNLEKIIKELEEAGCDYYGRKRRAALHRRCCRGHRQGCCKGLHLQRCDPLGPALSTGL